MSKQESQRKTTTAIADGTGEHSSRASIPEVGNALPSDKWNQVIYEQANRNHLHQDNLRWSLSAGFGAFFLTGMATINNPQFKDNHDVFHKLQFALVALGTIYLFVLMIEGWYYNLYLAHLVDCEVRLTRGSPLRPVAQFDRRNVKPIHPSFFFILMMVVAANITHLGQAATEQWGFHVAWKCCLLYALIFLPIALLGRVPRWLDRTLDNPTVPPKTTTRLR